MIALGYFLELDTDYFVTITYDKSLGKLICYVDGILIYEDKLDFEFVITDRI